jgi:hypothetical protein
MLSLQRSAGNQAVTSLLAGSSGQPLDAETRGEMEEKFGEEFGDVRIHNDEESSASALRAGARAYTTGRDIAFGTGFFAPHTREGRLLLAHELAHVVQQRRGKSRSSDSVAEGDARQAAGQAASGNTAVVQAGASGGVQADSLTKEDIEEQIRKNEADLAAAKSQEEVTALDRAHQTLLKQLKAATSEARPPEQVSPASDAADGETASVTITPFGAQQSAERQRKAAEINAPENLLGSLRAARIAAPAKDDDKSTPPAKLGTGDTAAGLAENLRKMGIRTPATLPSPQVPIEEWDLQPGNPSAKRNLVKRIKELGGDSYDPNVVPHHDLLDEYYRLKILRFAPIASPSNEAPTTDQRPALDPEEQAEREKAEQQRKSDEEELKKAGLTVQMVLDDLSLTYGDMWDKYGFWEWRKIRKQVRSLPPKLVARLLPEPDRTLYTLPGGRIGTIADERAARRYGFLNQPPPTGMGGIAMTAAVAYSYATTGKPPSAETLENMKQLGGNVEDFAAVVAGVGQGRAATQDVSSSGASPRPNVTLVEEKKGAGPARVNVANLPKPNVPGGAQPPANDVVPPARVNVADLPKPNVPGAPANDVVPPSEPSSNVIPFRSQQEQQQQQDQQSSMATAAGQDFTPAGPNASVASAGTKGGKPVAQLPPGPKPPAQLRPGGRTTLTHTQLRNLRPGKAGGAQNLQGTAGKQHVAELVGGDPKERVTITTLGPRFHDVREPPHRTGWDFRREVKTYREYLTETLPDGTKVTTRNLVRATKEIRDQIAKDVEIMKQLGPNGERRVVQWDFTVSPPDDTLRKLLIDSGLPFTEVESWGKK